MEYVRPVLSLLLGSLPSPRGDAGSWPSDMPKAETPAVSGGGGCGCVVAAPVAVGE